MKIIKSSGCTAFYTRIDGKDLDELSMEEKEALLSKLIKIHNLYGINITINQLLDSIEYEGEDGGYCDQCGDTVYRQIYDLDEVELPVKKIVSDKEITAEAMKEWGDSQSSGNSNAFIDGAKWMREQCGKE